MTSHGKLKAALSASKEFNKVAAVFGGAENLRQVLRGIDWIDKKNSSRTGNKNESVKADIFRAYEDDDPFHTARRFAGLLDKWERGVRPSLPATAHAWLQQLGLDKTPDDYPKALNRTLLVLAGRAEMVRGVPALDESPQPREPAYHSRIHFMHVLQATGHLIEQNDHMLSRRTAGAQTLTGNDKRLLLIAALAHDIDHPGRGNSKDPQTGHPVLYENEDASFAIADKLFDAYGLSDNDRNTIRLLLRTTDPNGPHKFLKDVMKAHESSHSPLTLIDIASADESRYQALTPLLENRKLCYMAAILSDADLYVSAGAGLEANLQSSNKLNRELAASGITMDFTTASSRDFFLKNIVGEQGFASAAGRKAFNAVFKNLLEHTKQELAADAKQGTDPQIAQDSKNLKR